MKRKEFIPMQGESEQIREVDMQRKRSQEPLRGAGRLVLALSTSHPSALLTAHRTSHRDRPRP